MRRKTSRKLFEGGSLEAHLKYLRSAADLRNSIHFNFVDDDFANSRHGTIRYLFDSNVVHFFLNPMAELEQVWLLGPQDRESASALAITTAEFLFSRELCGQWGRPALISSDHARELEARADSLVNHLRETPAHDALESQLRESIADAIRMAATPGNLEASTELLLEMEPHIRKLVSNEAYEARMFSRLGLEDLLEPMHLDEFTTKEVLNPPKDEVRLWTDLIDAQRRLTHESITTKANVSSSGRSINNKADASTAAQLVMLNEAARANPGRRMIRFVLVTLDRSYYNAAVEWYENWGRERLDFFPFRRISQYMPYLNTNEMPNNVNGTQLLEELTEALDNLPELSPQSERRFPKRLPLRGKEKLFSGRGQMASALSVKAAQMREERAVYRPDKKLSGLWGQLARNSVFINAGMIGKRISAFTGLADFLETSADVRSALIDFMEETIEEVERAHIGFNVQHHLAVEMHDRAQVKHKAAVRGMVMLRARFDIFTEGMPLYRYLNQIVHNMDNSDLERLYEKLSSVSDYSAYFFSGCVAFWAGAWGGAKRFADLALQRYDRETRQSGESYRERAELVYFQAVAQRYVALDLHNDLDETEKLLRKTLSLLDDTALTGRETDDAFLIMRARIESGMTRISLAFAIALGKHSRLAESNLEMRQAYDLFRQCEPIPKDFEADVDRDLMIQLEAELLVGVSGCLLQQLFFGEQSKPYEIERWHGLQDKIKLLLAKDDDIVPEVYSIAIDLLSILYCKERSSLRRQVRSAQKRMKELANPSRQNTTWLDRHALSQLANQLDQVLEGPMHGRATYS